MTTPATTPPDLDGTRLAIRQPAMLYPNAYVWLVFFSALDVMFTFVLLAFGATEINPIANELIEIWGMLGATLFKFALVLLAIIICEVVGRHRPGTGRRLSRVLVGIAVIPVIWSLTLLFMNRDHLEVDETRLDGISMVIESDLSGRSLPLSC